MSVRRKCLSVQVFSRLHCVSSCMCVHLHNVWSCAPELFKPGKTNGPTLGVLQFCEQRGAAYTVRGKGNTGACFSLIYILIIYNKAFGKGK